MKNFDYSNLINRLIMGNWKETESYHFSRRRFWKRNWSVYVSKTDVIFYWSMPE